MVEKQIRVEHHIQKRRGSVSQSTPMPIDPKKVAAHYVSVNAPKGVSVSDIQWIEVKAPCDRKILAAVARPKRDGLFPAVVILHGTHGFREEYVRLAQDLARGGFVAVAGSWFAGCHLPRSESKKQVDSYGESFASFIDCPQAPTFKGANIDATKDIMALIDATRSLAGVRADRIGLFGHSRGAIAALLVASTGVNVQAVVSSAAMYTTPKRKVPDILPITLVENLEAPVLILHGTKDEFIGAQDARIYELALQGLGKPVEAHYYKGAPHGLPFIPNTREDVRLRAMEFYTKYLAS